MMLAYNYHVFYLRIVSGLPLHFKINRKVNSIDFILPAGVARMVGAAR